MGRKESPSGLSTYLRNTYAFEKIKKERNKNKLSTKANKVKIVDFRKLEIMTPMCK